MIKIHEEGPDLAKWPLATARIRFVVGQKPVSPHIEPLGIVWVSVKDEAAKFVQENRCTISDAEAKKILKDHPPGTLIDLHTGNIVQGSPQSRLKLIDAIEKAVEKNGEQESSKNNPV
jgi:hypothetical protein